MEQDNYSIREISFTSFCEYVNRCFIQLNTLPATKWMYEKHL